jgi:outer membrane protein
MFRKLLTATTAILTLAISIQAQEQWTLMECIAYAQNNSLSIRQAEFNARQAELTLSQSQFSRLPSLNGDLSGGLQFGRTIDPTTNLFVTETSFAGRLSANASIILFNGNRINNSIKQGKIDREAARLDAQAEANNIALRVAQAYLSILLAEEQWENARTRLQLSREQLEQTDKMIRAGMRPENERFDFLTQIARDEQTIVEAENLIEANYLSLKQLMEIDPAIDFIVARPPSVDIPPDANANLYTIEQIYAAALQTQPQIRANDLRINSAQLQENIARSGMLPTIALFGSLGTNYSSLFKDFNNPNFDNAVIVQNPSIPVLINGEQASLATFDQRGVVFPRTPFFQQINNNFGQNLGLSMNVPLYNNHRNRVAIEQARVNALNQEVISRQIRQQLKADVQRAAADARAAQRSMEAAQRTYEAASIAFDNAQKRFDVGAINSLEYATARNNLDQSEIEIIRAKYQYLFNLKVVDFYLGRELRLD